MCKEGREEDSVGFFFDFEVFLVFPVVPIAETGSLDLFVAAGMFIDFLAAGLSDIVLLRFQRVIINDPLGD